ncbi:MAG: oxidoreductase family protein [Patescibacteria group bacterium]
MTIDKINNKINSSIENKIGIPTTTSEITSAWLENILSQKIPNSNITSIKIDNNFVSDGLLGKVARVMINYKEKNAGPKTVIVKFQISNSEKEREGEIYDLLSKAKVPYVPHIYGQFGNGNLVMEDLSLTHSVIEINQEFTTDQINNVVSMLSDVNSQFWSNSNIPKEHILHFINSININMENGWNIFKDRYQKDLGQNTVAFEWMWKNREIVSSYYNSGLATLTHGDVNRGNVLFSNDGNDEPKLIDWQLSGQKVLPFDLSYFMVQHLTVEQRRKHEDRLLKKYYQLLPDKIQSNYTFDHLLLDYRACTTRSMLSAVTAIGPMCSSRADQFDRADTAAERIIAAIEDLKPIEAIQELQDRDLFKL